MQTLISAMSGWAEFEILWKSIPRDIKKDIPEVEQKYQDAKKRLSKANTWGSTYSKNAGRYITWQEERKTIESDFVQECAYEEIINCLHRHKLLLWSDKAIETGGL